MKAQLSYVKYKLDSSFWFIPSLMTLAAVAASFAMVALDRYLASRSIDVTTWLYSATPDGARQLLVTIASSIITATSLVFSMTLVALTLASQQLGPRLLESFMRDRANQFVLGFFVATFVYSLLILRTVYEGEAGDFVPYIATVMAIGLSIASFGVLIFFIHHVSASIQADAVVARVGNDLDALIDKTLGPEDQDEYGTGRNRKGSLPKDFDAAAVDVRATGSGYLQTVDSGSLKHLAMEKDICIRIVCRPGHFLVASTPIAYAYPPASIDKSVVGRILQAFVIGPKRTPAQDMEYEVRVIAEIAVRALSPGINDYYTAVACVDRLTAALASVMSLRFPAPEVYDADGNVLLLTQPTDFEGLVRAAFDDIRQSAQGNTAVTIRLLESIATLGSLIRHGGHRRALETQVNMLSRSAEKFIFEPNDRSDVQRRVDTARQRLADRG